MSPASAEDRDRRRLEAPFFEIGPKNLMRLPQIIAMAVAAADAGREHGVSVVVTVPAPLITSVRDAVPSAYVFAQGMDVHEPGPSVGRVISESLADAGAHGVMLNHDSHPLDPESLERAMRRADAVGLMTMVCAGTDAAALEIAALAPTVILYEPPELIGLEDSVARPWIRPIDRRMREVAPDVLMMHAGGVAVPGDAFTIMADGAAGTGCTSAVVRAESPGDAARSFVRAVRRGYDAAFERVPR